MQVGHVKGHKWWYNKIMQALTLNEEEYSHWIHDQFEQFGWMYEPQAPQGDMLEPVLERILEPDCNYVCKVLLM